jgi:hypothetical protein
MKLSIEKRDEWSKKHLRPWSLLHVSALNSSSVGWFTIWIPWFILDFEYK